jgi:hypothetical protein
MSVKMEFGPENFANYRRLSYQWWYAIAEFVDNSTQSYFDNRERLDAAYALEAEKLTVTVTTDLDLIRVRDNAMGMSLDELRRALVVGRPPAKHDGRCRYGLGMKTAACWIGDRWRIATKRLGEPEEISVEVDVNKVAAGDVDLPMSRSPKDPNLHYTMIEISSHHRPLRGGRTIGRIKDYLKSIYRHDISDGTLSLFYNDDELTWDKYSESKFLRRHDGSLYRKNLSLEIAGANGPKTITGWVGILAKGARSEAGFSILHRNRVIKGWPDSWRPYAVFGEARNDLINQRIVGELCMEEFEVSHTKDDLNWYGDEEEQVGVQLQKACQDYISAARIPRKDSAKGPSEVEIDAAVKSLLEEIQSKEFRRKLELHDVAPSSDMLSESKHLVVEKATRYPEALEASVGPMRVRVFLDHHGSPNDPYFVAESKGDHEVIVVVNVQHPHFSLLEGEFAVENYLRHCVYDGIAEHKAGLLTGKVNPDTIKMFKDDFLRVAFEVIQDDN